MTTTYTQTQIADALLVLNAKSQTPWQQTNNALEKHFRFADFTVAFACMTQIALIAEKMQHHPEWTNVYSNLTIRLTTHDVGGISEKDFALAHAIEECALCYTP